MEKKEGSIIINYVMGEDIVIEEDSMRVFRSPHRLKVPQEFDKELAYLSGYHMGDGYLEDIYKTYKRQSKGGYEIDYADSDINQIELINKIIKDKFNHNLRVFKRAGVNLWIGRTSCKVLHWFLNKRLELPIGRKSGKFPRWIFGEKILLSNFLSGFFDAEGDISRTTNKTIRDKKYYKLRIQLTQKDLGYLLEVINILKKRFNIKSDIQQKWKQDGYTLRIGSFKEVKKFKDRISFRNPTKKEKLRRLVESFKDKRRVQG